MNVKISWYIRVFSEVLKNLLFNVYSILHISSLQLDCYTLTAIHICEYNFSGVTELDLSKGLSKIKTIEIEKNTFNKCCQLKIGNNDKLETIKVCDNSLKSCTSLEIAGKILFFIII